MSFKPIDGKNEDFRRYLDRKGVIDALTKSMVKCFQERPENAIEYLLENMGQTMQQKDTIDKLQNELTKAKEEIKALQTELEELKAEKSADISQPASLLAKEPAAIIEEEPQQPVPSPPPVVALKVVEEPAAVASPETPKEEEKQEVVAPKEPMVEKEEPVAVPAPTETATVPEVAKTPAE